MNGTEKYLFEVRLEALRDVVPLDDADLNDLLGVSGAPPAGANQNPEGFNASESVETLCDLVQQWRRSALALCGLTGMDSSRVTGAFDSMTNFRDMDPLTILCELLESELARRGPVARSLTKWLVQNAFSFASIQDTNGWSREQLTKCIAAHLDANNSEYARALWLYFTQEAEDLDTDAKLAASCVVFRLPFEDTFERAAIMEVDGELRWTAAGMRAVWLALQKWHPKVSESTARMLFDLSSDALEREQEHGCSRSETWDWLTSMFDKKQIVKRFPTRRKVI